ncbi:MAG: tetratricopeptide repeat protein [Myxococcota bacterium]
MTQTFPLAEVARILGVPAARVRALVDAGVCQPVVVGEKLEFTFQDLVKLRAAKGVQDAEPSSPRGPMPAVQPVTSLVSSGRKTTVQEVRTTWSESGQGLLFGGDDVVTGKDAVEDVGEALSLVERRALKQAEHAQEQREEALGLFEQALAMETEDPAGAVDAYRRALELDPNLSDVYVNLGRMAHQAGRVADAVKLYEKALSITEDDPVAHYNVALALEDRRNVAAAVTHYQRAVELDPRFGDAHYNLARLYERTGQRGKALQHLLICKRLQDGKA